jgi:hypothetical protein
MKKINIFKGMISFNFSFDTALVGILGAGNILTFGHVLQFAGLSYQ